MEGPHKTPQWADDALDKIHQALVATTASLTPPKDDRLFHFTDSNGLLGIVSSRTLWATNARCLNDATEIRYGIGLIRTILQQTTASAGLGPRRQRFREKALEYLDLDTVPKEVRFTLDPFVASFSESEKESHHWLYYGRGGDGYALEFRASGLVLDPFELRAIVYEESQQEEMVRVALKVAEEALLTEIAGRDERACEALCRFTAHRLAVHMWGLAASFKHRAFQAEKEWRLVSFVPAGEIVDEDDFAKVDVGFRANGNRIVPYLKVRYEVPFPLARVVMGSKVEPIVGRQSIKYLLREHECDDVVVAESEVHLR